ncbi:MAG: phosphoribosylformylglycinamidine cyclo-ligase [Planctomycetota bacterium]|jgi:phosphoribosylformylglycinamidine cyclo-ligase
MPLTYTEAGVDLDAADHIVDLIQAAMRRTHGPRVFGRHGGFAGMFRLDFNEKLFQKNYREPVLVACADGVGTKVKLAAELGVRDTIGIDCVAMNVNDLIVQGAEPLFFLDYLGLHKNVPRHTAEVIEGVARGCEIAGCALLGGETAEMPDIYAEGDFDLAGFAVGVVPLRRAIDPMRVEPDDVVVGLAASGVHSNGFTLINRIIRNGDLRPDQVYPELGSQTLGAVLLTPTRIYARPIVTLLWRYKVKRIVSGMAHVTGGGLPGNLERVLPPEVDARIDGATWTPPPVFDLIREHGNVDPQEMRRVFNMGVGFVLIVRPTFADSVARQLNRLGEKAFVMGRIVRGSGRVCIDEDTG